MIKNISGSNVKGLDFIFELHPVNIVVGDNFTGKSAVLEAVRLAMVGHVKRLGKQPSATMKLAGELKNEMTVSALINDSVVIQKWTRKKNSGASYSIEGELPNIPPVLFDINEYFDRTSAERIKFVFDQIDLEKFRFGDGQILERLGKLETTPAAISKQAVTQMLEVVQSTISDRERFKLSRQVWMEKLVSELKTQAGNYKSKAEFLTNQLSAYTRQMPPKTPKDVSVELAAEEKTLADLTERIAHLKNLFNAWQSHEKHRTELQTIVATIIPEPNTEKINTLTSEKEKLEKTLNQHTATLSRLRESWRNLNRQDDDAIAEIKTLETKLAEIATRTTCPYCKSRHKGWQDEVRGEYENLLEKKRQQIAEYKSRLHDIDTQGKPIKEASEKIEAEISRLKSELETAMKEFNKATKDWALWNGAKAELNLMNETMPKPDISSLPATDEQRAAVHNKVLQLRKEQEEFNRFASVRDKRDEVQKESIIHAIFEKIFKMASKEVTEIQSDMVTTAIGDILTKANSLTDGILKAPLEFRDGELGMTWNNGWINYQVFSGTEEALAFAGFALALATESPIKIVLIDEMDRIQRDRRLRLVQRMIELTENGVIDQFIGAGLDTEIYNELAGTGNLNLIRIG